MKFFMLMLALGSAAVAEAQEKKVLVINDSGYYLMITPQDAAPRFEKIDVVIKAGDGPVTPGDPTAPPTPGDADPIAADAEDYARIVGNKHDAEVLAAVYKFIGDKLVDGSMQAADVPKVWGLTIGTVKSRLVADWDDALTNLDALVNSSDNMGKAMQSVAKGLAKYAGVSEDVLLSNDREDVTGIEIIAIIEAIMKILELFGILK